ncbi:ATP-binding protein [Clostridium minihomine]|uniref:ATP-binding protein n=1 Tax=Clostridium minihomine TaxID=2045012 RepID=UPI000C78F6FC|nr:4Fe-4S dicluster domain-containing protein [Clostridium minihomine]
MKKIAFVSPECVACGCCVKVCPKGAITVPKGIRAEVNEQLCIGCTRCAKVCPAQVITMIAREDMYEKAQAVV